MTSARSIEAIFVVKTVHQPKKHQVYQSSLHACRQLYDRYECSVSATAPRKTMNMSIMTRQESNLVEISCCLFLRNQLCSATSPLLCFARRTRRDNALPHYNIGLRAYPTEIWSDVLSEVSPVLQIQRRVYPVQIIISI